MVPINVIVIMRRLSLFSYSALKTPLTKRYISIVAINVIFQYVVCRKSMKNRRLAAAAAAALLWLLGSALSSDVVEKEWIVDFAKACLLSGDVWPVVFLYVQKTGSLGYRKFGLKCYNASEFIILCKSRHVFVPGIFENSWVFFRANFTNHPIKSCHIKQIVELICAAS